MKFKFSIIIGLASMLVGFVPLSLNKSKDISYTIYASNVVKANKAKEELIVFYKQYCYSSLLSDIEKKIEKNLCFLPYDAVFENNNISIIVNDTKIKMTGYLYKNSLLNINYKSYFTSTNSMPLATSIKVETLTLSDQIWYETPL